MGNWRTVNITGELSNADALLLRQALRHDLPMEERERFVSCEFVDRTWCLSFGWPRSLFGLNDWPATRINRIGNLAERDYDVDEVVCALEEIVAVAPSFMARVDCGGERESLVCVATILVGEGLVRRVEPMTKLINEIPDDQALRNLIEGLSR